MLSRLDSLSRRVEEMAATVHQGAIPTTTPDGKRAWITGSGLSLWREVNKWARDSGKPLTKGNLPAELLAELDLWCRVELQSDQGGIVIATRKWAREIIGISEEINKNDN
jgi:hypothetical protein